MRRGAGRGTGKGYRNLRGFPKDPTIHSQSARGMKQPQKVNLKNYRERTRGQMNDYKLGWFKILRLKRNKYVIYGYGQWSYHLMNWRGCNFMGGRLPESPAFDSIEDAIKWLKFQVKEGVYYDEMNLTGTHESSIDEDREVYEVDLTIRKGKLNVRVRAKEDYEKYNPKEHKKIFDEIKKEQQEDWDYMRCP